MAAEGDVLVGLDAAARPLRGAPDTAAVPFVTTITALGGGPVIASLTLVAAALALAARRPGDAALLVLAVVTARVLTYGFKLAFARDRPRPTEPIEVETSFAFPSGHSSGAAAAYGALAVLALRSSLPRALRVAAALVAGVAIGAVAYSRIFLGVHHLTDVVGGVLLGFASLAAAVALVGAARRARASRGAAQTRDAQETYR